MKTSNKNARQYVTDKVEFDGSNTFGRWYGSLSNGKPPVYVVFSYGYHFPMFAYINGEWFENGDKYQQSTSKQQNQLRPSTFNQIYLVEGDRLKTNINEMACGNICK